MDAVKCYWVGFNRVKGIGAVRFQALLDRFGTAEAASNAAALGLAGAGIGAKVAERIVELRGRVDLIKDCDQIEQHGIHLLTWNDELYPPHLKEVDQPPPVWYRRGEMTLEDHWVAAIVATRQVTSYGRQVTEELATVLAQSGWAHTRGARLGCG